MHTMATSEASWERQLPFMMETLLYGLDMLEDPDDWSQEAYEE